MAIAKDINEITPQGLYELAQEVSFKIRHQEKISPSDRKDIGFDELYHCYALTIGSSVLETPFLNRRGVQIPLRQFIGGVFLDCLLKQENEQGSDILELFSGLNKTINKPGQCCDSSLESKKRKQFLKVDFIQAIWDKIIYEGYSEDAINPFLYGRVGFSSNMPLSLFSFADFCSSDSFPNETYKRLSFSSRQEIRNNTKNAVIDLAEGEKFLNTFLNIKDFGLNREKNTLITYFLTEGVRRVISGNFNQGINLIVRIKKDVDEKSYFKLLESSLAKEIKNQEKKSVGIYEDFLEKANIFLQIDIIEQKREAVSVLNDLSAILALQSGVKRLTTSDKTISLQEIRLMQEGIKVR